MYRIPMPTIAMSAKTLSSSSAPLITKKSANSGEVHLSPAAIRSPDSGQILQNTVPSIIQVSREEKLMCTRNRAASTRSVAVKAWKMPITKACFPVFFRVKYS